MASSEDGLFLLEVLVDKVSFHEVPCFADKDFRTCINVSCVAVESLEICDDDPTSCVAKSGGPFVKSFNAGKSCLFSLKSGEISSAMGKFPIKVVVSKSLACGCIPTKVTLGEAVIDMTKEFVQARNKYLEDPSCISYQALKDVFRLTHDKKETGEISMFLRISCFGKSIVTKFQASNTGQVTLGASRHSSGHDRTCNPPRKYQTLDEPCVCGVGSGPSGPGSGGTSVCKAGGRSGGYGVCPPGQDTYNSRPCSEPDDPCYCTGPKEPYKSPLVCRNVDKYCLHIPKDCCPTGHQVVFQLPEDSCNLGHKQRVHLNLTSDGIGDLNRDEPGNLMPSDAADYPGVVYDLATQVYKLKINKTVEMPGRKSKLEYQFITPVMTHQKPKIPVKDTRTTQCPVSCPEFCNSPTFII